MAKKTIAQRKAEFAPKPVRRRKTHILPGLTACIPFGVTAYVCKYQVPGYTFTTLVCLCIIGVILFYTFIPLIGRVLPRFARVSTWLVSIGLAILLVMFAGTEYFLCRAALGTPNADPAYVVVLGAKVRDDGPSISLMDRINGAYTFLAAHPDTIAVVSGGMGADEPMTEAQCMYDYLTAMGISPERIWMEDQAESTDENLRFSLELIEQKTGERPASLGLLSSEYHLLRAGMMLEKLGVEVIRIPAATSRPTQLINQCMREFAGVWHFLILGN